MVKLSDLTTIRVGGDVKNYFEISTKADLVEKVLFADEINSPLLVLGEGSNILPQDCNFTGVVIKTSYNKTSDSDAFKLLSDLSHLPPSLVGIPGTLGAAVVQNAGAYGMEICDFVSSVEVLDRETKKIIIMTVDEIKPTYRSTLFKESVGFNGGYSPRWIVLDVNYDFQIPLNKQIDTVYNSFYNTDDKSKQEILEIRDQKGMLSPNLAYGDKNDKDRRSCGSFFKNPQISENALKNLPDEIPRYKIENSEKEVSYRIPAAALIEASGISKGFTLDEIAYISSKHSLAITNPNLNEFAGKAIRELATHIQKQVFQKFHITLDVEPIIF